MPTPWAETPHVVKGWPGNVVICGICVEVYDTAGAFQLNSNCSGAAPAGRVPTIWNPSMPASVVTFPKESDGGPTVSTALVPAEGESSSAMLMCPLNDETETVIGLSRVVGTGGCPVPPVIAGKEMSPD